MEDENNSSTLLIGRELAQLKTLGLISTNFNHLVDNPRLANCRRLKSDAWGDVALNRLVVISAEKDDIQTMVRSFFAHF